jgi:orotate phosphoribosyltransferase
VSIVTLDDLIAYLEGKEGGKRYLDPIRAYRQQYGASGV